MISWFRCTGLLAAGFLALSCDGTPAVLAPVDPVPETPLPAPARPDSIKVVPEWLQPGDTVQLVSWVYFGFSRDTTIKADWASSKPEIAAIDSAGRLIARAYGATTITARVGGVEGSGRIAVLPPFRGGSIDGNCGVAVTGGVWCWGGSGPALLLSDASRLGDPAAGYDHLCALDVNGTAYCWGGNSIGQLGTGTTVDQNRPTPVAGGLHFVQLDADFQITCGVTTVGAIYCWGWNQRGLIGDGTTVNRAVPTQVASTVRFTEVSVSQTHVCAVSTDGSVYCWGRVALGSEAGDSSYIPVRVAGAGEYVHVATGFGHACALTAEGDAKCWGSNWEGQLGTGAGGGTFPLPSSVLGRHDFVEISAGDQHTCGITDQRVAYCWGSNYYGQLGNGTRERATEPRQVEKMVAVKSISAERNRSCAVATDDTVWCWGAWTGHYFVRRSGWVWCSDGKNSPSAPCMMSPGVILADPFLEPGQTW